MKSCRQRLNGIWNSNIMAKVNTLRMSLAIGAPTHEIEGDKQGMAVIIMNGVGRTANEKKINIVSRRPKARSHMHSSVPFGLSGPYLCSDEML
jgi:hypothetical protein